jgi:hypothetical protein
MTDLAPRSTREFLTACVAMMKQNAKAKEPPYYFGPMDLVLREGEAFTPAPYDAERWRFAGTPKNCFSDAFDLAIRWPELTYAEGYASGMIPGIHHAWAVTADGTVVDPTWAANGHHGDEYLGIRFPNSFVLDVVNEKGTYGVLDYRPLWMKPLDLSADFATTVSGEERS